MDELIIGYILEAVLVLIFISLYTYVVGSWLPKYLLKIKYIPGTTTDRGLRKYRFPEGRGVVYEPNPSIRKYVSLYMLFVKDGAKYIKCKLADNVGFFKYAAVVFDNQDKVIDVIKVNDTSSNGMSKSVMLPTGASYVSFVLYSVNGKNILGKEPFEYDVKKKRAFVACVAIATTFMALAMRFVTFRILDIVGEYLDLIDMEISVILTIAVGIIVGILGAHASLRANWQKRVG